MTETALVLASRWSNASSRRREGLRAAHEQNAEALTDLLVTYMRLKSSRGARVSSLTLEHYCESVRRFLVFTGPPESPERALNQLAAEDFEVWMLTMQQAGLAASSIKRHLYGVRNLMKALVWAGALASDPSAGVRPPSDTTPAHAKKQALSVARYAELLALPASMHPADTLRVHRDTALLELGGSLGLRAAELVGLNATDIDLNEHQLRVLGKGGKGRTVPMTARVERSLRLWQMSRSSLQALHKLDTAALLVSLSGRNYGGRLTTKGARSIAATYYQELGLAPELWGLHTLRRTAGTHLYRATRDLHVVADVLGHASVNTSAIYAKMDTEVRREALEAMERLRDSDN